jgi:hypothetical protein
MLKRVRYDYIGTLSVMAHGVTNHGEQISSLLLPAYDHSRKGAVSGTIRRETYPTSMG